MSERATMDLFDETRSVERPRFFDGQQLFAADLDGIADFNRAMWWLHNRSLHQPGIGNGFAVAGRRGEREVRVQPGYALDQHGREIVLLDTRVETLPPVSSEADGGPVFFDLTVSYPSDDDLEKAETREGVCLPRGVVRVREKPVFCWVRLTRDVLGTLRPVSEADALDIQNARKIVLARVHVLECKLDADLSIAVRRSARPPQQPRITCGCEGVEWQPWMAEDPDDEDGELPVGLFAHVDTTAGGFTAPPCYTARVCGPRPLAVEIPGELESGGPRVFVLDGPAYVVTPERTGFECFIPLAVLDDALNEALLRSAVKPARARWRVTWLGIEA